MKPTLKAPGTERLKLKYDIMLSSFAFNFNLRRYIMGRLGHLPGLCVLRVVARVQRGRSVQVDPIKPTLKAPGTKRLKLECDELLSKFAFRFNLRRYDEVQEGVVKLYQAWRDAR